MAVRRKPEPAVPNGFIASAARLPTAAATKPVMQQAWQEEAWRFYDTVGPLRFVANWVGNIMSRGLLRVAVEDENLNVLNVVNSGPAAEAMDAYYGSVEGQSEMLQQIGINLTIAGEGYHYYDAEKDKWYVLSSGRVTQHNQQVYVDTGSGGGKKKRGPKDLMFRTWTPHPREPLEADSPVRSNMSTLQEIVWLNQHVAAQLQSRLAGAGLLMLPSEIQFAAPQGIDPQANQADTFMQVLGETMMDPIKNRGSASAVVPLVVTAPGEALDKVQHLTFWSPLDAAVTDMRDTAIKNLALGLDTPPEVLMGVADTNHWNAWMVDEAAVKSHLEPRLSVVTAAITTQYLRPALQGLVPDPDKYHVVADTSAIRLRPDLSNQAIDLYDRGELSGDALRRETGFDAADAPDEDDKRLWLLQKVALGSTTPEQSGEALDQLGVDVGTIIDGDGQQQPDHMDTGTAPTTQPRAPRLDRAQRRRERQENGEIAAVDPVVAACNALVFRALERAGNKMCDAKAKPRLGGYPAHDRYMHAFGVSPQGLLDGAWSTAPDVLAGIADAEQVVPVLNGYVYSLLDTRNEHDMGKLEKVLRAAGVI